MTSLTNHDTLARLAIGLGLTRPLVFLDLETTGVSVERDRIVQIGIVRVEPDGTVAKEYDVLVNPEMPIPPEATEIHGITDAMVKDAPTFSRIALEVLVLIEGCDFCGYNARKFDAPLLRNELERVGAIPVGANGDLLVVDPYLLWLRLRPRTLAGAMAEFCGVEGFEGHRAIDDVRATIAVLNAMLLYPGLPAGVAALDEWGVNRDPSWIDNDGKIAWKNGAACLTFGKNAGRMLKDLARNDPSFLRWMLSKDFPADTKAIIDAALRGKFPTAPATTGV